MKAQEIAAAVGARVVGDANAEVKNARSVASADEHSLVFVEDAKWLPDAIESRAAVLVTGEFASANVGSKTILVAAQPKLAFARAAVLLHPKILIDTGVHPSAVVHPLAKVGAGVSVGPNSVLEAGVAIGARTSIAANCVIGAGVAIGADSIIKSNVTVYPGAELGDRVIVHSGAVLGSDGFGYVLDRTKGKYEKFPQIGKLKIGNDVEIGANSTIDRGALDETVIGDGVKIDNLVHIGHNVQVGHNVVIAAQTGVSGSAVIEQNVIVAGQVGIADHVRIEEGAILGAQCGIPSNKVIRGKGVLFWGTPARPIREYLKELAVLARLAKK
jgi:UDP-3-O-[3-hydroxymyristoyl] glucosamine N-acyltransferase